MQCKSLAPRKILEKMEFGEIKTAMYLLLALPPSNPISPSNRLVNNLSPYNLQRVFESEKVIDAKQQRTI